MQGGNDQRVTDAEPSKPGDAKMSNEQIIRNAISRSISHNEIVHCEVSDVASDEIHSLVMATETGEWDYSQENRDEEGREVLDVYTLDGNANEWRIKVTFA